MCVNYVIRFNFRVQQKRKQKHLIKSFFSVFVCEKNEKKIIVLFNTKEKSKIVKFTKVNIVWLHIDKSLSY